MNLPSLPRTERTYKSAVWPTVIKYRAFTAGQQTLLLQVSDPATPDADKIATMEQLFESCVSTGVPFSKLPIGVVEEIFIRMRCLSIGEIMKIRYQCNNEVEDEEGTKACKQEIVVPIPLDKVVVKLQDGYQDVFDLPGGYHIKMRQPSFSDASALNKGLTVEFMIATFIECLYDDDGQVWTFDSPEEPGIAPAVAVERAAIKDTFVKWVGDNIESETIKDISDKFFRKIPRIHYDVKIKCPGCGKEHPIEFNSMNEIFI